MSNVSKMKEMSLVKRTFLKLSNVGVSLNVNELTEDYTILDLVTELASDASFLFGCKYIETTREHNLAYVTPMLRVILDVKKNNYISPLKGLRKPGDYEVFGKYGFEHLLSYGWLCHVVVLRNRYYSWLRDSVVDFKEHERDYDIGWLVFLSIFTIALHQHYCMLNDVSIHNRGVRLKSSAFLSIREMKLIFNPGDVTRWSIDTQSRIHVERIKSKKFLTETNDYIGVHELLEQEPYRVAVWFLRLLESESEDLDDDTTLHQVGLTYRRIVNSIDDRNMVTITKDDLVKDVDVAMKILEKKA